MLSLSPNVGHVLHQPFHPCLDRADERQTKILHRPAAKHTAKVSDRPAGGRTSRAVVTALATDRVGLPCLALAALEMKHPIADAQTIRTWT